MTKKEALKIFNQEIKPGVIERHGKKDKPALQLAWQCFIDGLCKDGTITQKQYDTWGNP